MRKIYPESVIAVCDTQIGYTEKANERYLDDFTVNAGSANYTKYARNMDRTNFYNFNGEKPKQGSDYCTVFLHDSFRIAGDCNNEELKRVLCVPFGVENLCAGARWWMGYFKDAGRFYSEPKIGDIIFMTFSADRDADHVGIVSDIGKDGKIYTIEGNRSNKVDYFVYPKGYEKILGFGRPRYDESSSEEVEKLRKELSIAQQKLQNIAAIVEG